MVASDPQRADDALPPRDNSELNGVHANGLVRCMKSQSVITSAARDARQAPGYQVRVATPVGQCLVRLLVSVYNRTMKVGTARYSEHLMLFASDYTDVPAAWQRFFDLREELLIGYGCDTARAYWADLPDWFA